MCMIKLYINNNLLLEVRVCISHTTCINASYAIIYSYFKSTIFVHLIYGMKKIVCLVSLNYKLDINYKNM